MFVGIRWLVAADPTKAPRVSAVTCHRSGSKVVVSGMVTNPNTADHIVTVGPILMHLSDGRTVRIGSAFNTRRLSPLTGHSSTSWATTLTPALAGWYREG